MESIEGMTARRDETQKINSDLLSTKLALPRARLDAVPREGLFAQLDGSLEHSLTLLSAPAGFGKTTLVRSWVAAHNPNEEWFKVAWLALDAGDNDPVRFWCYMIAACQHFAHNIGWDAVEQLKALRGIQFEALLTCFLNELNTLTEPCVLVLEDYHTITLPQIHETFAYFLTHLPSAVHIILLSRSDPPLPLARLRASGNLLELRTADVRFSLEETRLFLQQALPFPCSEQTVARLYERTEGWSAGIKLAAFALRRYNEPAEQERFIETLTGRYRPFFEYLVSDVLNAQPQPLQTFLLQTGGLQRLTSSLCDAVTGRNDSDLLLEQIERANLFLEPLDGDGQWYHYHSLFAEAMQHEALRRIGAEALYTCFRRASYWYEQHNQPKEAIEAALQAKDFTLAAQYIERWNGPLFVLASREFYTIRRWLTLLPRTILQAHPALYPLFVIVLMFDPSGRTITEPAQIERIETLLNDAEAQWEPGHPALGEIYTLRALLLTWQDRFKEGGVYARQALTLLKEEQTVWRSTSLSIVGAEEQYFGSLEIAFQHVQESLELNHRAGGNPYGDRAIKIGLGEIYVAQGELHLAADMYRQVLAAAGTDMFDRGKALLGLARLSYEWNMLDIARQEAQEAQDLGVRLEDKTIQAHAAIILARIMHALGETNQAQYHIAELITRVQGPLSPLLYHEIHYWQVRLHLAQGNLSSVRYWIDHHQHDSLPLAMQIQDELLIARWLIVQNRIQEALALLEQCPAKIQQHRYTGLMIEAQALIALSYYKQGHFKAACQSMEEILPLACSKGYQRTFLDEGEMMTELLRALEHQRVEQLPALSASSALIEPLSIQEQRVLRLFIAGLSKPEIARELVISTNTVKTHLQRIYRKLHVTNRAEARATVQLHQRLLR